MEDVSQADLEGLWRKAAKRLRLRLNFAWWYQELIWPLLAAAIISGGLAMASRRFRWGLEEGQALWNILIALVAASALFAWRRARRKWLTEGEALVRLEADLELNNALSTAEAGRGSWPPFDQEQVLSWRPQRLLLPVASAVAFVLIGFAIPILPIQMLGAQNKPYIWTRLQEDLIQMVAEEMIQEDYADQMKGRLEELAKQNPEDWFSASSLEATDSLIQAHERELNRLQRDLMKVDEMVRKAGSGGISDERRDQLRRQFDEAMEGLRNGQMKPNEDLLKKLAEAGKKGIGSLSGQEKEALQERLRKLTQGLLEQQGEGKGYGDEPGSGERPGEGKGRMPGQGEPKRGPGDGGDLFGKESPNLKTDRFESLEEKKKTEPDSGDLLNLNEVEHDKNPENKGPTTSGNAKSKGLGGDRVWKDRLDPDEQRSLKSFFESSP